MAALNKPHQTILVTFLGYKVLLLAIAAGSQVGPAYDTSTSLLLTSLRTSSQEALQSSYFAEFITRLTSWDAIYFIEIARRSYVVEQEWAFGIGFPTLVSWIAKGLSQLGLETGAYTIPAISITVSHISHLLSVITLYQLGLRVWRDQRWALTAALLHIISPAGLFLSAPSAESTFSLLSFTGYLLFAESCYSVSKIRRNGLWVLAGVALGLATTFRANGLLNGLVFAWMFVPALWTFLLDPDAETMMHLVAIGIGGMCVGLGYVIPQYLAYREYCLAPVLGDDVLRSWCTKRVPSIYSFVQREYWNTGLFRYWVIPNIPLFAMAAPMLFVLLKSGKDVIVEATLPGSRIGRGLKRSTLIPANLNQESLATIVGLIAATQMLFAMLTLTSYHVQIITRLSSGYPAWYWWLAATLRTSKTRAMGGGLVVFMIMYGLIQAALYASFLPPA